MRIAVVGSGGVGGYFGGRLAAAGSEVSFLARGAHLEALRSRGLRIHSPLGDLQLPQVHATDDPYSIGPVDVAFFTVKLYDTDSGLMLLPPLIGADTVVVPFQNGVDSVERLMGAVGAAHTAGGTAYVAAVVAEPGVIRHTANARLTFGELDGSRSDRLSRLQEACGAAGFSARLSERIDVDIWKKFMLLSGTSGMTASTRKSLGLIREDADMRALLFKLMHETTAVGRAAGIDLPEDFAMELDRSIAAFPPTMKASMANDLEAGRPLELDWLAGKVVALGRKYGVPTPAQEAVYAILKPYRTGLIL